MDILSSTVARDMSTKSPGKRLELYLRAQLGTQSRTTLAAKTGISRQQLSQWFDDKGEPRMSALAAVAFRIGVRRVDLVAAYDGVTAPETEKEPRPEWAEALMTRSEVMDLVQTVEGRVTEAIEENRRITREAIVGDGDPEEALLPILMEELRPVFEGLAAQFRGEVEQLLDARLGGTDKGG
jgi:transcriptional regulator with XRE-family HTH domain